MTNSEWYLQDYKKAINAKGVLLPKLHQRLLINNAESSAKRDREHLHPSSVCKKDWCPRASWYELSSGEKAPDTGSNSLQRLNIFAEGNRIHEKWQTLLWQEGLLYGKWLCLSCQYLWESKSPKECPSCASHHIRYREVPVYNEEHMLIGHADGIVDYKDSLALIEIKSVGVGTFRMEIPERWYQYTQGKKTMEDLWKGLNSPFLSHIRQASLYMYCLGIPTVIFLYEWKPAQDVKEFVVKLQDHMIEDILVGCRSVKRALDNGTSVMRPKWAKSSTQKTCKTCYFNARCWKDGDDPEVPEDHEPTGEVLSDLPDAGQTGGGDPDPSAQPRRVVRR
jgi:hypothetical protein